MNYYISSQFGLPAFVQVLRWHLNLLRRSVDQARHYIGLLGRHVPDWDIYFMAHQFGNAVCCDYVDFQRRFEFAVFNDFPWNKCCGEVVAGRDVDPPADIDGCVSAIYATSSQKRLCSACVQLVRAKPAHKALVTGGFPIRWLDEWALAASALIFLWNWIITGTHISSVMTRIVRTKTASCAVKNVNFHIITTQ